MLCSVGEDQSLAVWDVKALTPATSVKSQMARAVAKPGETQTFIDHKGVKYEEWQATPLSTISFSKDTRISSLLHPATHLNKILVAFGGSSGGDSGMGTGAGSGSGGSLELWNIKTCQLIYRFDSAKWMEADSLRPEKLLHKALQGKHKRPAADATLDGAQTTVPGLTCMEQSPAVDVIGLGFQNGMILLLNIQLDRVVAVYSHAAALGGSAAAFDAALAAPVSAITFRTDSGAHAAQMATTSVGSGSVVVWDLDKKQVQTILKHVHGGSVGGDGVAGAGAGTASAAAIGGTDGLAGSTIHTMYFLPNEPLLVTVGNDNAIRLFIFDQIDGSARLLKERSGHALPPTKLRFYPSSERGILDLVSAGADRSVRAFSLAKDEQSREMSQGHVEKTAKAFGTSAASLKLTPVTCMAASATRDREWPSIVTGHAHDAAAYTWRWSNKSLSPHKLLNTTLGAPATAVTAVAASACGNYAFVGLHNGRIDQFHMQSGTFKATYGSNHVRQEHLTTGNKTKTLAERNINLQRKAAKQAAQVTADSIALTGAAPLPPNFGHTMAVTGLASDGLNKQLVSASLDGSVCFWEFRRRNLLGRIQLNSPVGKMASCVENELIAVATDDCVVHVIDINTRIIVRRFTHHTQPLTDMIFSPDGRWLLTSSIDCCVRVFDLPSATLVDFLSFSKPVSSLTMSPRGDFLATTHVNSLAIQLWANKEYFGRGSASASTTPAASMPAQQPNAAAPSPSTATSALTYESQVRRVAHNMPIRMEVAERAEVMDDEDEENVRVKKEQMSDDSSEDEDGDDEEATSIRPSKRSRGSDLLSNAHIPTLQLPEDEQFDLITYTSLPRAQWTNLLHIDIIKERNKSTEAVKPAEPAPFFLTALSSLSNEKDGPSAREKQQLAEQFGVSTSSSKDAAASSSSSSSATTAIPAIGSRVHKSGGVGLRSKLLDLLDAAKEALIELTNQQPDANPKAHLITAYASVSSYLHSLSPSSLDAELASLGLDPSSEEEELRSILEYLLAAVETGKHFEATQVIMNRVIKTHGTTIASYPALLRLCSTLHDIQRRVWGQLEEQFHANIALVTHLAQMQVGGS